MSRTRMSSARAGALTPISPRTVTKKSVFRGIIEFPQRWLVQHLCLTMLQSLSPESFCPLRLSPSPGIVDESFFVLSRKSKYPRDPAGAPRSEERRVGKEGGAGRGAY